MTQEEYLQKLQLFLDQNIIPHSESLETDTSFPRSFLEKIGELCVYGVTLPQSYGGCGFSPMFAKDVIYKIALATPSLALVMGIPTFTAITIETYATEEQKRKWLPDLIKGNAFCAFAYTEAGGHSSGQFHTQLETHDDQYLLNGSKAMISWGGEADYYLTIGSLILGKNRSRPVAMVVPEAGGDLQFGQAAEKMAFPALVLRDIHFENKQLDKQALLGRAGMGLKIADEALQMGRLYIMTVALAMAQTVLDDTVAHITKTRSNGSRLGDLQSIQFTMAEMRLALEACRGLVQDAWQKWTDQDSDKLTAIALAKVHSARTVMELTDKALQLQGGAGYLVGNKMERRFKQARLFSIVEGTSEIMLQTIANRMIGGRS